MSRKVQLFASSFAVRAGLAAGLGAACVAGTAAARPEDTFPQAPTRADIFRWLLGNSDLNPDAVVTMTDELVVAITDRQDGRGVGRSTRLTLREEVINPDAAAAWGGRSIQLDLDLDCARHRVILGARRVYARPNLQGSARITRPDSAWSDVPPDTVIDDVAKSACAPPRPAQLAAAQPAPSPPETPAPADLKAAPAESPAPARLAAADTAFGKDVTFDPPASAAAPQAPEAAPQPPAPPVRLASADTAFGKDVAFDPPVAPAPPARPARTEAPEAAPQPPAPPVRLAAADPPSGKDVAFDPPSTPVAPAAPASTSVTIAAPSATSVAVVAAAPAAPASTAETQAPPADQAVVVHNPFAVAEAQRPPEPAARPAPAAVPPARPPEFAVQIAAAASADLARDSWQSLKAKLPSLVGPRTFAVEPVEAKGRTLYRALLLGFASPDEAASLCKELRSQSVDCILRQMK